MVGFSFSGTHCVSVNINSTIINNVSMITSRSKKKKNRVSNAYHSLCRLCIHHFFLRAVLAAFLNALAVGAPFVPGFLIFSLLPALIRFRFR